MSKHILKPHQKRKSHETKRAHVRRLLKEMHGFDAEPPRTW